LLRRSTGFKPVQHTAHDLFSGTLGALLYTSSAHLPTCELVLRSSASMPKHCSDVRICSVSPCCAWHREMDLVREPTDQPTCRRGSWCRAAAPIRRRLFPGARPLRLLPCSAALLPPAATDDEIVECTAHRIPPAAQCRALPSTSASGTHRLEPIQNPCLNPTCSCSSWEAVPSAYASSCSRVAGGSVSSRSVSRVPMIFCSRYRVSGCRRCTCVGIQHALSKLADISSYIAAVSSSYIAAVFCCQTQQSA